MKNILVEVSGHKLKSSHTRFVWFSTPIFRSTKFYFRIDTSFSCFADFFVRIFKTREEYGFLLNPPVEGTVNSMEQKTLVFCKLDVQEFHLRERNEKVSYLEMRYGQDTAVFVQR